MEEVYTVKVRAQPDAARLYPSERRYSASTVGGLGAVHLALAAVCILLAGLDMAQPVDSMSPTDWTGRYGGGAWLGMAAALAGLTGILAWRRWYIDNNIRWFFICSCVAGVTAVLCLVVTAAALAVNQEEWASTRLQVLSSLREKQSPPHSVHFPPEEEKQITARRDSVYRTPQNSDLFEVQRSLRNAKVIPGEKDSVLQFPIKPDMVSMDTVNNAPLVQTQLASREHSELQNTRSHQGSGLLNLDHHNEPIISSAGGNHHLDFDISKLHSNVPILSEQKFEDSSQKVPPDYSHLENHEVNDNHESSAVRETEKRAGISQNEERHHVSARQALDEDDFVEENFEERHIEGDESLDHHVLNGDDVAENLRSRTFHSDQVLQDGSLFYIDRNHDDTTTHEALRKASLSDNETDVNKSGQSEDRYIFHKHLLSYRGGETRLVIVINLLVASVLEVAWSILSAKIAWKGMKSGYPEDGPPRTGDEHSKEKRKTRSKKVGLRKPDIISNHDGGHRKSYYKEERRDPSLPMQESPTEYQERVRRFLASNSLATIDGGIE